MPSSHQSLLCKYRYDALDRLIGHAPANEAQLQRFYCKSRLATEIQGALRHSIVQHGDLLLAQQQKSGKTLDATLLATDQKRSVMHIISKADQQQKPIAYSPYGYRCAENGLFGLLGFNGERPDTITGHYLLGNGYRAFNPVLMRLNSPDNLSPFEKGGLNPYAYCLGDPINRADPNGQYSHLTLKITRTTRRVKIPNQEMGRPGYVNIKDGVSAEKALRARDRLYELETALEQDWKLQQKTFETDFALELTKNISLQNLALKSITSNNISLLNAPPGIQKLKTIPKTDHRRALQYLNDGTKKLPKLSLTNLHSGINKEDRSTALTNYIIKIKAVRNPDIIDEKLALSKQNFVGFRWIARFLYA